jgi:hypothetical protein
MSHPARVSLFGSDGKAGYQSKADSVVEIPYQEGKIQQFSSPITGNFVVQKLRTTFESARFQVVLTEVSFDTEPATAAELEAAQKARLASQPPVLKEVNFLPTPYSAPATPQWNSPFYGVCGHLLHAPPVMTNFSPYWNIDHSLPFVAGKFGWVREALYMSFLATGGSVTPEKVILNRREVERALTQYDKAGVRVMLTPMFRKSSHPAFNDYFEWLVQLAKKHPSVGLIELHNEPNLGGFWQDTVDEYVQSSKAATAIIKKSLPKMPVIIGSFSGWGHAQNLNTVKAHANTSKERAFNFAEAVFQLGGLEFSDAVSAHPYRHSSAPEGGVEIESPTDPQGFEKEIQTFWNLVQKYNTTKKPLKLHFSEIGYSSSATGYSAVGTIERQADYLSRLMLILLDVRLKGTPLDTVFWYDLKADDAHVGEYEANFGLVSNNLSSVRPGYNAYRRIAAAFGNPDDFSTANLDLQWNNWANVVKSYSWKRKDGALVIAYWRMNQLQQEDKNFDSELRVKLPNNFGAVNVELNSLQEETPRPIGFKLQNGELTVPLHLTSRAAWIVIKNGS